MKFSTTIEFKSAPKFFRKEKLNIKNNTVRFVNDEEDKKILSILNDIKYIRIVNTAHRICAESFVRTLIDVTRYVNPINSEIVYIFTWER